jgi:hypothetical protein
MGWGRGDEINEEKWNKGRVLQSIDRQIRLRADRHASQEEGFLGPAAGAKNGPIQSPENNPGVGESSMRTKELFRGATRLQRMDLQRKRAQSRKNH